MWIIEPPPSQGRIKNPLGSISALTKHDDGGPAGPPVEEVKDLSHICKLNLRSKQYYNHLVWLRLG